MVRTLVFWTFWLGHVLRATTTCTFSTSQLQKWSGAEVFWTFWLRNVLRATTACTFSTSELQKWREHVVFCTFWLRNVLRATTGVHFFDIWTSKSGPSMVCFVHFDFEMCFAPQRRALFRHRNFQKWSEPLVFLTLLTSKCASRHDGVHFFDIATSKSGPNPWCFAHSDFEMCFAPRRRAIFHRSSGQLAPHPPL